MRKFFKQIIIINFCFFCGQIAAQKSGFTIENIVRFQNPESQSLTRQIQSSLTCSSQLKSEVENVINTGVLKTVQVIAAPNSIFHAFTENSEIFITAPLLRQLQEKRYKVVGVNHSLEVTANQTAFVLGYLIYRLKTADTVHISKFSQPFAFSQANIKNVATAFITGWNSMIDCAQFANQSTPLAMSQVGELLFQARYKFAFILPESHPRYNVLFLSNGQIDLNEENIQAIAEHLRTQKISDIR